MNSQEGVIKEIADIHSAASGETQRRLDFPVYRSSVLRHPTKDLHRPNPEGAELVALVVGHSDVEPLEADLTVQANGEPIGERILVRRRLLDGEGQPVRHQLNRDLTGQRGWSQSDARA
jgi:protocatechuate 3,4-dioxygenase, beta subunit